MFVVRLPTSSTRPPAQITVFVDEPLPRPRLAVFAPVDVQANRRYHEVQLTRAQWQSIENLRQQWCATKPSYRALRRHEPFYDIGVRCQTEFGGRFSQRIMIPVEDLPIELQTLIDMFPALHREPSSAAPSSGAGQPG
jgi:hypothetical protein